MNYQYGKVRLGKGGIPVGGSDNSKLWLVFSASENPVQLIAGSYWAGDSGENYGLVMFPPGVPEGANGTATITGAMGAVTINFQMAGGETAVTPAAVWPGQKTAGASPPVVPPFWSLYVLPVSGASAANFEVRLMGMDLI